MENSKQEEFKLSKLSELNIFGQFEYVKKYFVPLRKGSHAVYIDGKFEIMEQSLVKTTYFNRMPKAVSEWYFKQYDELKSIDYKINKPVFYDDKINLCPKFMHSYKPYEEFDESIKAKVDIMLNYIFIVLADRNTENYDFILKWLSNVFKGNKNNSCLYLKSIQGIGKSTLFCFIRDHVIGKPLVEETGSEPIKSKFNDILAGKLLVVFEEMETFSTNEWTAISSRLKRYITSNTITIEKKGVDSYNIENINNYVILSNNDAVKDSDGRRYFILDLNTEKTNQEEFWNNIYENCFNDEVGCAFFCKLLEINTDGFNPQSFPLTKSKIDAVVNKLDSCEKFLKEFVIQKNDIKCSVNDLYQQYVHFCDNNSITKKLGLINFNKKLKEYGIKYYKSNDTNKFDVSYEYLVNLAKTNHWIHDLDNFELREIKTQVVKNVIEPEINELKELLEQSNNENTLLKDEIAELRSTIKKLQQVPPMPLKKIEVKEAVVQNNVVNNEEEPQPPKIGFNEREKAKLRELMYKN